MVQQDAFGALAVSPVAMFQLKSLNSLILGEIANKIPSE